jgi:hypothetical protein
MKEMMAAMMIVRMTLVEWVCVCVCVLCVVVDGIEEWIVS